MHAGEYIGGHHPAPVDHVPVDHVLVDHVPVHPAPVHPAPVHPAPGEHKSHLCITSSKEQSGAYSGNSTYTVYSSKTIIVSENILLMSHFIPSIYTVYTCIYHHLSGDAMFSCGIYQHMDETKVWLFLLM